MPLSTEDAAHAVELTNVIADKLTAQGPLDRDAIAAVQAMTYLGWCFAADLAHVPPPKPVVCSNVIALLKLRLDNQDPFENFGLRVVQ